MIETRASQLLARVMEWGEEGDPVGTHVPTLQILAEYKYDQYQRFSPGKRFMESLALWLNQFEQPHRATALELVLKRLVYVSEAELSHLVGTAHPDVIVPERLRLVADEQGIPAHRVSELARHRRSKELSIKSLYLGLSDGARTNELRRSSDGEITNEQIWHAHELGEEKASDMLMELKRALKEEELSTESPNFNLIWLLDDFAGSGNTYIRFEDGHFKGKLPKLYALLQSQRLVEPSHYEVFLLLYMATRKAIDHIEYWTERFTTSAGYKPLQLRVLSVLENDISLATTSDVDLLSLLTHEKYVDAKVADRHFKVGGEPDARWGFAHCALPLVLAHNTPNNSIYILWGPEGTVFPGLFPRVSRHREF